LFRLFRADERLTAFGKKAAAFTALAFIVIVFAVGVFKRSSGIDFYQYWVIGRGPIAASTELKSPYTHVPEYSAFVDTQITRKGDIRLLSVHRKAHHLYENGLDIPGSPVQYALFAFMPGDYSLAYGLFLGVEIIAFVVALVALASVVPRKRAFLLGISAMLPIIYWPLENAATSGNLSLAQFSIIVGLCLFYRKGVEQNLFKRSLGFSVFFLGCLIVLTMIKPNIALVTLVLTACYWRSQGTKLLARAGLISAGGGALVAWATAAYYGSWSVFVDWYRYFPNTGKIPYAVLGGNSSATRIISDVAFIHIHAVAAVLGLLLVIQFCWALFNHRPKGCGYGKHVTLRVLSLLDDAFLCTALAVTVTLALSPLVWVHYYVLALIPSFWLISNARPWSFVELMGVLSIVISSGELLVLSGYVDLAPYVIACGWVPAWFGLCYALEQRRLTKKSV
jgi:hypothetical protein